MATKKDSAEPVTKETLTARLGKARTAAQLDAIEADARAIGHSVDGVLLTALADKRADL